jgi:hypothetical protein
LLFNLLLQADNKSFTKAASNKSVPSVSIESHPKHIIVDCNDDGLTKSDLEAICKATTDKEATTTAAIFKSIVAAAERVHIQSGNFSLEFRHNLIDPKEAGLKPVWAPAAKEMPNLTTRMTIYLHDHGDKSDVSRLKQSVIFQFMGLDGTCLLFLRKLEQVTVRRYMEHGTSDLYSTDRFYKKVTGPSRVSLERFSGIKVEKSMECLYFHVEQHSGVTLAFPLKQDGTPLVSTGKIFNILSIQPSKYNVSQIVRCLNSCPLLTTMSSSTSMVGSKWMENGNPLIPNHLSTFCIAIRPRTHSSKQFRHSASIPDYVITGHYFSLSNPARAHSGKVLMPTFTNGSNVTLLYKRGTWNSCALSIM